jgi:hypothetical protein
LLRVGDYRAGSGDVTNHHLQRIIHEENLLELFDLLSGHQLLVLYLTAYCSDNNEHAADQIGSPKQTISKHINNIRRTWEEHIPEAVEGHNCMKKPTRVER